MNPKNRKNLADRVVGAAERALADQKYVSAIDVLLGVGWLNPSALKEWRLGRVECLERVVRVNLPRLERIPIRWNRSRFHLIGIARTGDGGLNGHIPVG